jgi:selenide,water dikinase
VLDLIGKDVVPGGTWTNAEAVEPYVTYAEGVDAPLRLALADAQTSGGLLIAVPPEHADRLVQRLQELGTLASAVIGELGEGAAGTIRVEE